VASPERHLALPVFIDDLPADRTAPRHARAAVRDALSRWGMQDLIGDAELVASELTANAAEYGHGTRIGFAIGRLHDPRGRRGIFCQITDASPVAPRMQRESEPDSERGRGLQIVAALATTSGFTTSAAGKTAWFMLTEPDPEPAARRQPERELEAGA
jgi:anti-sigma regulatory factor (Ser/Thr protein kinase)